MHAFSKMTPSQITPRTQLRWSKVGRTPLFAGLAVLLLSATGCGYSEEEMQAQLDKYDKLAFEHQAEKDAHAQTAQELEETKQRVLTLKRELERMGVNLDTLSTDLQKVGT
jgi:chemotaxis protein MotB